MWLTDAYVLLFMSCALGAASVAEGQTAEVPGFVSREACVVSARTTVRTIVHALAVPAPTQECMHLLKFMKEAA